MKERSDGHVRCERGQHTVVKSVRTGPRNDPRAERGLKLGPYRDVEEAVAGWEAEADNCRKERDLLAMVEHADAARAMCITMLEMTLPSLKPAEAISQNVVRQIEENPQVLSYFGAAQLVSEEATAVLVARLDGEARKCRAARREAVAARLAELDEHLAMARTLRNVKRSPCKCPPPEPPRGPSREEYLKALHLVCEAGGFATGLSKVLPLPSEPPA